MDMQSGLPTSRHFTVEQVGDGIYAAVARDPGGAMSNAGIVDLGDATLIFDTFMTTQAAEDLRAAAERLTGRPARYVVNSHWHDDHVLGNQVFPDATILATPRTRALMETEVAEAIARYHAKLPEHTRALRERLSQETDPTRRARLETELAGDEEIRAMLPTLRLTLPTATFTDAHTFRGARRTVQLLSYGGGHTDSDAFLYLPDDRLAFLGDLLFVRSHPWLGHGHPENWVAILERIETLDVRTAVPGHGPVGVRADCARVRQYIADVGDLAHEALRARATAQEMMATPVPAAYATWDSPEVLGWNMEFLHDHLAQRRGGGES